MLFDLKRFIKESKELKFFSQNSQKSKIADLLSKTTDSKVMFTEVILIKIKLLR